MWLEFIRICKKSLAQKHLYFTTRSKSTIGENTGPTDLIDYMYVVNHDFDFYRTKKNNSENSKTYKMQSYVTFLM